MLLQRLAAEMAVEQFRPESIELVFNLSAGALVVRFSLVSPLARSLARSVVRPLSLVRISSVAAFLLANEPAENPWVKAHRRRN